MSDTMTPTDKPMTVDMLEAIAREVGQMERRHCIGRSQGFDIRDGYAKLRAAIDLYGKEQYARGVNDAWPAGRRSGEPVATIVKCETVEKEDDVAHGRPRVDRAISWYAEDIAHLPAGTTLYAAPQPREPLTEEQIWQAVGVVLDDSMVKLRDVVPLARAIERAHNIRSEG